MRWSPLFDNPPFMHDRLRRARLQAGFDTARAAIERFGWKPSTYRAHENGQNKFRASDAGAYARAFKCSSSWLLFGEQRPALAPEEGKSVDPCQKTLTPKTWCEVYPPDGRGAGRDDWRELWPDGTQRPPWDDHFDLSLDSDDLNDVARRGDILRFAPAPDHRSLSDGDIVAIERRTATGVDILPIRVFFRHGQTIFAAHPAAQEGILAGARILGKAIWLLRRLAL